MSGDLGINAFSTFLSKHKKFIDSLEDGNEGWQSAWNAFIVWGITQSHKAELDRLIGYNSKRHDSQCTVTPDSQCTVTPATQDGALSIEPTEISLLLLDGKWAFGRIKHFEEFLAKTSTLDDAEDNGINAGWQLEWNAFITSEAIERHETILNGGKPLDKVTKQNFASFLGREIQGNSSKIRGTCEVCNKGVSGNQRGRVIDGKGRYFHLGCRTDCHAGWKWEWGKFQEQPYF